MYFVSSVKIGMKSWSWVSLNLMRGVCGFNRRRGRTELGPNPVPKQGRVSSCQKPREPIALSPRNVTKCDRLSAPRGGEGLSNAGFGLGIHRLVATCHDLFGGLQGPF